MMSSDLNLTDSGFFRHFFSLRDKLRQAKTLTELMENYVSLLRSVGRITEVYTFAPYVSFWDLPTLGQLSLKAPLKAKLEAYFSDPLKESLLPGKPIYLLVEGQEYTLVATPFFEEAFAYILYLGKIEATELWLALNEELVHEAKWHLQLFKSQNLLYKDELTSLHNYRFLDAALEQELKRYLRFEVPFCVMFVDVDQFKGINDRYGHLVGDQVLKQVAEIIQKSVRDVDLVIRYGGDEFVVILIGADLKSGLNASERVLENVKAASFMVEESRTLVNVTVSIGMSCCPIHGKDKRRMLQAADESMYQSKTQGKNKLTVFSALPLEGESI